LGSWNIDNIRRTSSATKLAGDWSMSQHGSDGQNGESPPANRGMTSSKAQTLADDIADLEDRCQYLESRNGWLTKQLFDSQRQFLEKSVNGIQKMKLQSTFKAWHDALHELTLEKQLEQQTNSLDKCQQVARELGVALALEQDIRRKTEMAHKNMKDDLQRALAHEDHLKRTIRENQVRLEVLEQRVQEAESALFKGRADAQAVIDSAAAYQQKSRMLEEELKHGKVSQQDETTLEQSIKLREEAHGVMREAQGIMEQGRLQFPETEP